MKPKITPELRDWILEWAKQDEAKHRLYNLDGCVSYNDLEDILNAHTEERGGVTVKSVGDADKAYENHQSKVYPEVVDMRSFITGYLWGVEGLTDFPKDTPCPMCECDPEWGEVCIHCRDDDYCPTCGGEE